MAKRELSNTLKNLKFMQRAALREEKSKKQEDVIPVGNFISHATVRKCVVIMEGDPHPGAALGRMSFGSFNPSVDKLNENATNLDSPEASANATGFSSQTGDASFTDNGSSLDGAESPGAAKPKSESNGDHKRKQSEMLSVPDNQHKSPKISQVGLQSSSCSSKGSFKQQKREKLDWSILRPKSEKKE